MPTTHSTIWLRTCKTILWKQKHSTPWTRWNNTVKTMLLQAGCWLNSALVLSYSGQKMSFIWISWKFAATIIDSKRHLICCCLNMRFWPLQENHSSAWEQAERCLIWETHHYLNLAFAHLQIMLIVDIHPLQGTTHSLICSHKEHYCKTT